MGLEIDMLTQVDAGESAAPQEPDQAVITQALARRVAGKIRHCRPHFDSRAGGSWFPHTPVRLSRCREVQSLLCHMTYLPRADASPRTLLCRSLRYILSHTLCPKFSDLSIYLA